MEALVGCPEQTDIRDGEEDHGQPFEAESECPACLVGHAGFVQCLLHDDAAPQQFEPFALPPDFDFVARRGEREIRLDPADAEGFLWRSSALPLGGHVAEKTEDEAVERVLEVFRDFGRVDGVVGGLVRVGGRDPGGVLDEDRARCEGRLELGVERGQRMELGDRPDVCALHLVEDGVVRAVDLVPPVHVCAEQPPVEAAAVALDLVCAGVGAQHVVFVEVVAVRRAAARVVGGEAELVKVLPHGHGGGGGREGGVVGKVALDDPAEDGDRVGGAQVEAAVCLGEDGGGRVRVRVTWERLAVDHVRRRGGGLEAGGERGAGGHRQPGPGAGAEERHEGGHGGWDEGDQLQRR